MEQEERMERLISLVCSRRKLSQLLDYLPFDGIDRLLGILLRYMLALEDRNIIEEETNDLIFPAAESMTAPASFSTLAALTSASPSF